MQTDGLDTWTWSGGTTPPVWVPNAAPGSWMWLMVASLVAGLLMVLLISIVDRPVQMVTLVGGAGQPPFDRPLEALSPREIVALLTGLPLQPSSASESASPALAYRLRSELWRWECRVSRTDDA